jgi:hypothetical protein
MADKHWVLNN